MFWEAGSHRQHENEYLNIGRVVMPDSVFLVEGRSGCMPGRGSLTSRLYSALVHLSTAIICIISASILGFAGAFGGALAIYSVRYLTDSLIVTDGVDDSSTDPTFTFYFNVPYLFPGLEYPNETFTS